MMNTSSPDGFQRHQSDSDPLRVLFIGFKYDYGIPAHGFSFEYLNIFESLEKMAGVQASIFAFDEVMRTAGQEGMNKMLIEEVQRLQPHICLFSLFTEEIYPRTIRTITESGKTVTCNWFADDHWRFETFSKYWASYFHWVITTDPHALEKYHAMGFHHVIRSQWGYNHHRYYPFEVTQDIDSSFIGQVHSDREKIIRFLLKRNIRVECWGKGWKNGRVDQEEMINLYSRSRVNLNFTESSPGLNLKRAAKMFVTRYVDDSIHLNSVRTIQANFYQLWKQRRPQIKGRNFEIPGSGGFLLTASAEGLDEYFRLGEEIQVFSSRDELIDKLSYYLVHENKREKIRRAGYERARRDHTFEKRFQDIFNIILKAGT